MTNTEKKLYNGGIKQARTYDLNEEEYKECFDHWVDAVDGCGVTVEDNEYFQTLLDVHIKEWCLW